ncbi:MULTISPECIES: preprotein translocase subunit YajC [Helcococcus]|uniref:Preprotein translocase subunit YajC n=2 Tax=Helcococcus bovis TaxID=3153252 RepID=A0ABW9F5T7_9FIRM
MTNLLLAAQQQAQGSLYSSLLMFALIGAAFYFLLIRPQKKQQQEFKQALNTLKVGDIVVTRSGAKGKVIEVKEDTFIIETGNNNTQIEYLKQALGNIVDYNSEKNQNANSKFSNVPVGDLSYGNDKRFLDKIEELKEKKPSDREYDLLLEDVYEFMVLEDETDSISVQNKFRLDEERANKIVEDLEYLGILSLPEFGKRKILIDPRN